MIKMNYYSMYNITSILHVSITNMVLQTLSLLSSVFLSLSICFFVFPATSVIWHVCALKQSFPFRSNVRTPAKDSDSPLPSIHERLAYLRPSRELLDFYRQKIAQFDEEHAELQQMLEQHRRSTEDQVRGSKSTRHFRGPS